MENNLWVTPQQIDPELDLDTIDPGDDQLLALYDIALAACEASSQILWALSGRKFHVGTYMTERYMPPTDDIYAWARPTIMTGYTYDSRGYFLINDADFNMSQVKLSGSPVTAVASVRDLSTGDTLEPEQYRVVNKSMLEFDSFPPGGIEVAYTFGQTVPTIGRMAALQLAKSFFAAWGGDPDNCQLPDRVTQVSREGVSWVLMDNQQYIDDLRTGIYVVDLFLRTVNPARATQKAKVFSPDMPRGRRRSI